MNNIIYIYIITCVTINNLVHRVLKKYNYEILKWY